MTISSSGSWEMCAISLFSWFVRNIRWRSIIFRKEWPNKHPLTPPATPRKEAGQDHNNTDILSICTHRTVSLWQNGHGFHLYHQHTHKTPQDPVKTALLWTRCCTINPAHLLAHFMLNRFNLCHVKVGTYQSMPQFRSPSSCSTQKLCSLTTSLCSEIFCTVLVLLSPLPG